MTNFLATFAFNLRDSQSRKLGFRPVLEGCRTVLAPKGSALRAFPEQVRPIGFHEQLSWDIFLRTKERLHWCTCA